MKASILIWVVFVAVPKIGIAATVINIRPMITLTGQYDDNFYRTTSSERSVYTYVMRPGVQLNVETAKSRAKLNYSMDAYRYAESGRVSSEEKAVGDENYIGHWASFDSSYVLTDRLTAGLNDSFYFTRRVDRYDEYTDNFERRKHYINRLTPKIFYELEDRFSLGLRYRRQDIDYENTDADDAVERRGMLDLLYNPSRTRTFDLSYQYWRFDDKTGDGEDSDYISNQLGLTFQKRYKYFTFEGGAGYHFRNFIDSELSDRETSTYRFAVGGQNPPASGIGRRAIQTESPGIQSHIFLDFERNFNSLGGFRRDDRFTLSLGHLFWEKTKLILRGYYQISDYGQFVVADDADVSESREDAVYGLSGSLRYLVKDRWNLQLTVGKTNRDSNLDVYSYENTFIALDFEVGYTFGRKKPEGEDW